MTEETIDRLANEALQESRSSLKLFSVNHVQNKAHVWALSFSDKQGNFHGVEIDLWDFKTDDGIKQEIKRQLHGAL